MTAKNPGFTPQQRVVTLQSLRDIKENVDATLLWRVSGSVARELNVENQMTEISSLELAEVVEQVDAVITTPSTVMLEAMRLGRPVAALDYHNVPRFVPTAWTISARDHIPQVVAELLNPPAAKMAFQRDCLADCLCDGIAANRVALLIQKMINNEIPAGANGAPPQLSDLYANASVYRENDVLALQARLARAENENNRLKAQPLPSRIRQWIGV